MLLTDDQDVTLGGLDGHAHGIPHAADIPNPMPKLQKLLTEKGTTFSNAFVHTPICCPSRSSYMTGRYLHNSGTFENDIAHGCSNQTWADGPETRSFAAHAKKAGYHTSYSGKYLNQYAMPGAPGCKAGDKAGCAKHIPLGWDDWHGLFGNSRYYNGTISDNGTPTEHGDAPEDYLPDVFFGHAKAFVAAHLKSEARAGTPFLCVLATPSCHGPFTAAPKYLGHFASQKAPITPNFNHSNEDKHWTMRQLSPLPDTSGQDSQHNMRWETLMSVDDYVEEIVTMLEAAGAMDNTYFLYTSDHGFQLGQHRLPGDKRHPYEHDIRIPFVLRVPGVLPNHTIDSIVLSIDVAPTFTDIASGAVPEDMDGVSMLPLLAAKKAPAKWRTDFMVDYHGQGREPCGLVKCPAPAADNWHIIDGFNNTYTCVRTLHVDGKGPDSLYCEFVDSEHFVEFYDHGTDPWQLKNLALSEPAAMKPLKERLAKLRNCKGKECRPL